MAPRIAILSCAAAVAVGIMHRVRFGRRRKSPDPDNHRLQQLADDPIFNDLPPGVTFHKLTLQPSYYDAPAFEAQGWMRPNVHLMFRSAAPIRSVYKFYAEAASANGWTTTNIGALRIARSWQKTYANGASASAHIVTDDPRDPIDGPRDYQLHGSISLPG